MSDALSAPKGASGSTDWLRRVNPRQVMETRLARQTGEAVARAIKKDVTAASKVLSGERGCTIEAWCALIDLCDLKLVGKDKFCVTADEFNFNRRITARVLADEELSRRMFDDPE